jgi:hypothetical protein
VITALTPLLTLPATNGALATTLAPPIPALTRYQHTICAVGGFESLALECMAPQEDALFWLTMLGAGIVCAGPEAETVWEGKLTGASITIGQERIDLSLDSLANAVRVRYQPDIGAQVSTAFATNASSIAQYGRKELVYSGSGMTTVGATALRDALLNARRWPLASRASTVATGESSRDVTLTLQGTGWYYTLDWLTTSSTTTATLSTTTQLTNLITAYNAVNNYFSASTTNITASGINETQWIDADTTYRQAIERRLNLGTSSGQRQAYGVYEGRAFVVKPWAGATPAAIGYQRSLGSGQVQNGAGAIVQPWNVRPDAMYRVIELLDVAPVLAAPDQASSYYVERVTCTVDLQGANVRLEPAASTEIDVLLARIG